MWSPALHIAKKAIAMAASPDGESSTPAPPSPASRISSSSAVVGVVCVPYVLAQRSPLPMAALVSRRSEMLLNRTVEVRLIRGLGVR